ncbi:MAG: UDP-N-acetylglucosamine 2-epimerase (non-hydrolyzing) [Chloroflexota bacterium]
MNCQLSPTKIVHVVGARPNFMKVAPVLKGLSKHDQMTQLLVHTGQHYDRNMSEIFFNQLDLPEPDINLDVGSGSHTVQIAQIMVRFEKVLVEHDPNLVLVYGDVNSTIAAVLVCAKLNIEIGHIEAGLRSFDRTMPEEINRILTDQIATILFTPSQDADDNLLREVITSDKIHLVGNVMIDTLVRLLPAATSYWPGLAAQYGLSEGAFGLVTLHRPSNVDVWMALKILLGTLDDISQAIPLVFPVHPRTRQHMNTKDWEPSSSTFHVTEPMGYLSFIALMKHAAFVITDSGGVQEESTFLNIPCLTMRENTERPVTVTAGTNRLVGQDVDRLREAISSMPQAKDIKRRNPPPLWDGRAGERIAAIIVDRYSPAISLAT